MPQSQTNADDNTPPPAMTWGRAAPMLALCLVFDLLGLIFQFFWFFGPILLGVAAGAGWESTWVGGVVGGGTTVGVVTTAVTGFFDGIALGVFGVIMAIAVAFLGLLTVWLLLMIFNHRIFKANEKAILWMLFGLGVDMVPFIGALPGITGSVTKLYHTQIKQEKAAFAVWKAAQKELEQQRRAKQIA